MKKLIALTTAAAVCLSLAACTVSTSSKTETTAAETTVAAAEATEAAADTKAEETTEAERLLIKAGHNLLICFR